MSRISQSVLAVVAALTCAGLGYAGKASAADAPFNYLTEQGRLLDETGTPVDGTQLNFTFSLYTAATGGSAVWTEVQAITPDKGYFSARLGDVKPIDPTVFDPTKEYYLGIQVGTDTEMAPRQIIASVPFAINAKFADVANTAKSATNADNATNATNATTAVNAGHAGTADSATSATNAAHATNADNAQKAVLANTVTSIKTNFVAAVVSSGTTTATATCSAGVATGGGCQGSGGALTVVSFSGSKTAPTSFTCSCPSCSSLYASAACAN